MWFVGIVLHRSVYLYLSSNGSLSHITFHYRSVRFALFILHFYISYWAIFIICYCCWVFVLFELIDISFLVFLFIQYYAVCSMAGIISIPENSCAIRTPREWVFFWMKNDYKFQWMINDKWLKKTLKSSNSWN